MKILVIGGAGYIGSHVAREFLDRGYEVTVYDNLSTGREMNLFEEADFVQGDILDSDAMTAVMQRGFDGCVLLAGLKAAGESMVRPEIFSTNNICGAVSVINAAAASGIRCFLFSSSAAIFGNPVYLPIDENHPKEPSNYYGFTKLEIERMLEWYERLKGMKFASVRYFNAAGYDVRGRVRGFELTTANLLPLVMETAVGMRKELLVFGEDYDTRDGTCIRDYIHVNDLAEAHVLAFEKVIETGESLAVNLGSETGHTVFEMLDASRRITGQPIPARVVERRPGDPPVLVATSAKAHELLGWRPRYSDLDTLVESTWNVYRAVLKTTDS
ncbi:MAG TPA: UDP-glucose 4-epimerase GalE [Chlorobaculum parvum]|uniref:UDP-glucose 4-epimerase n=1 Tax=Chlorobaculum parvum TaxID=274539 RepID=A0A7C5DEE7_9CHLB|nr:UDP-glucose 4-epimerase GalE [Chlorobaculum parvum]